MSFKVIVPYNTTLSMDQKMKYAIIQGRGEFPMDMLRYDSCYPNSERDSYLIATSLRNTGSRWSICVKSNSENKWTTGRWESFGVSVVDVPRSMVFEYNSYCEDELAS